MTKIKREGTNLIKRKKFPKVTQWKGKTREEKRHQAMLNQIKKLKKDDDRTYL
ncbi:hypothetical protein [Gracilibacillus suaedae]|uniref:hypothetical protein n=1 Tax=Gracilibacillus suaedae TaxID=2820273 RepID=UPI001ABDB85D|nr:hypothetical protein [Gracilibacillus suaedae]